MLNVFSDTAPLASQAVLVEDTGKTLVTELIGLSMDTLQEELALQNEDADTYASVIQTNGDYLIFTQAQGLGSNSNIFSYLNTSAVFDDDYSLTQVLV